MVWAFRTFRSKADRLTRLLLHTSEALVLANAREPFAVLQKERTTAVRTS